MAVDEMLLERAQEQAAACLRFYGWSEPTLSLGYFQTYADRQEHPPSLPCAAVRRLTGGGAILHDAELTYSIVLPGSPSAGRPPRRALPGRPWLPDRGPRATWRHGPVVCEAADKIETARRTVSLFSAKIAGRRADRPRPRSAAVPSGGATGRSCNMAACSGELRPQHPNCPAWRILSAHPIELENVADLWLSGLSRRLGFAWQADDLDENEVRRAETLVESRYAWDDWTKNRGRAAHRSQETL